ncbi:MAG: N-6 DNA methylase [Bdellovibrionales bacterium]|nr:N-6 DNA methylase [Bdellovibrionales bacterium]
MAKFMAITSKGLIDELEKEIKELGLKTLKKESTGVWFEGNWSDCYKANLYLRTASRVILPVLDFEAHTNDELYKKIRQHDFTKYIDPEQTLSIDASTRESKTFKDQRFIALKIKDAIVDQFYEQFDRRPDIDTRDPDMRVVVRVIKNSVSVGVDTSGQTLSQRGYRLEAGEAPLREHLAAALIRLSGWTPEMPLVDPMCGSGTILIEAAMMAANMASGSMRRGFAFQRLKGFQKEAWDEVLQTAIEEEREPEGLMLFGSDSDNKVLSVARKNSQRAGVDEWITFNRRLVETLTPPEELEGKTGMIIVNPPYGERLGVTHELSDLYKDFAHTLKRQFQGWTCWILSGNEELTRHLHLKASLKVPVHNGNISCRFLKYEIR